MKNCENVRKDRAKEQGLTVRKGRSGRSQTSQLGENACPLSISLEVRARRAPYSLYRASPHVIYDRQTWCTCAIWEKQEGLCISPRAYSALAGYVEYCYSRASQAHNCKATLPMYSTVMSCRPTASLKYYFALSLRRRRGRFPYSFLVVWSR